MLRRIVGNAVFISQRSVVQVLAYDRYAEKVPDAHLYQVDDAISQEAEEKGRRWQKSAASTELEVTEQLLSHDVLLVYEQSLATDAMLSEAGSALFSTLTTFLSIGGIVVFLDGVGGYNAGTFKMFDATGLFSCSSIHNLTNSTAKVLIPGDAVAQGVFATYLAAADSVFFSTDEGPVVVAEETTGNPIVVHKVFLIEEPMLLAAP
jgi:hypothetical protein